MSITVMQKARLGSFMIIGLICLFLFIAIPVGFKLAASEKTFYANFEGESLSGLEQGAIVKFHGVPVGKVDQISYNPSDLLRVKVKLVILDDFPMKTDMVAQTGSMGITGLKYVELLGGTNKAPLLKEDSDIPTKKSMMTTITGNAEAIMAKIELLIDHLNSITDPDALKGIKTILDNTAAVSVSFQEIVARIDGISRDVKSMTGEAERAFDGGKMGRVMNSIDTTAQSMQQFSQDISLIVKQSREDIMVSMENLRITLENANALTKVLSENPSLLLRGEQQKEREVR